MSDRVAFLAGYVADHINSRASAAGGAGGAIFAWAGKAVDSEHMAILGIVASVVGCLSLLLKLLLVLAVRKIPTREERAADLAGRLDAEQRKVADLEARLKAMAVPKVARPEPQD